MKIFELTQLKEAVDPAVLAKVKAAIAVYKQAKSGAASSSSSDSEPAGDAMSAREILAQIENVRDGKANLNKDIDAELGKTGANPDDVHSTVIQLINNAARVLSNGQRARARGIETQLMSAAFGYINKKYLNGNTSFRGNTKDLINQVMRSQQRRGTGHQASSARAAGQGGATRPGDETNALDAVAADNARNADW